MSKLLDRKDLADILKESKQFLLIKAGKEIGEELADLIYRMDKAVCYAECCINDIHGLDYNYQRAQCLLTEAMTFFGVDGVRFGKASMDEIKEAAEALKPEIIKCYQGTQDSRKRLAELGL